jgi:4-coumarate--CoA ligase (photoactive yellow protein activation family)
MNNINKMFIKNSSFASNTNSINTFFESKQLRRIDNIQKLALCCATEVLSKENINFKTEKDGIGLIIATARGPVKQTCDFMDSIIDDGDLLASPLAFSASVHNCIELALTTLLHLRGPCITISQGASSFYSSLITARSWLLSNRCKMVLLGAVDESHPVVLNEFREKIIKKECASFFLLGLDKSNDKSKKELNYVPEFLDEINPSLNPFNLAYKLQDILTKQDIQKIIGDLIKTYLSARKIKIMEVFENKEIDELFREIGHKEKQDIFNEIRTFFSIDKKIKLSLNNLIDESSIAFKKNDFVMFQTSGSTGKKKSCFHSSKMIREEVLGVSKLFWDIKRIVSVVPTHHSYGFIFGLQMPKYLGVSVLQQPPLPNLHWNEILQDGDLLIVFPLFLKYLQNIDFKFEKNITILTATAPCPDILIDEMFKRGIEKIVDLYGSSESGAIAFRQKSKEAFTLFPFWDIKYKDDKMTGIFRKESGLELDFPDIIEKAASEKFYIKERKDGAVQVAGINVYPKKIENVLKSHSCVKDAVVRPAEDDEGGRLKAFVVLNDKIESQKAKKEIYAYLNSKLLTYEIPQNITFGDEIPVTQYGKKTNWR